MSAHHNNAQRRSTPHPTQSLTAYASSLPSPPQIPFENTQHRLPTNFPIHSSLPNHSQGAYTAQYIMSHQPTPMGGVQSPPPYSFTRPYHHPIIRDNTITSQNIHTHYQSLPHPGPLYQYPRPEGNPPLHSSFPATMYTTHQTNPLGAPTSPHSTLPTPPTPQAGPLSPSYIGSGVFHSLQYPSPMSTPRYDTYSPPFPGSSPYQSQYPPPHFGQRYAAIGDSEPQGDWYYVPRAPPPSQQYDVGPSYSGHYPTVYPRRIQSELIGTYDPQSFSSADSSAPYPGSPVLSFSHRSSPEIHRGSVVHPGSPSSDSEYPFGDKPMVRQPYHPNPPSYRSEWVMWAGNIPSDATHDEIYRFFSQEKGSDSTGSTGVISVFLISRSNCAFINFESESCLSEAISRFNGVPLRADDARCARMVCRVRLKDDDLKAGVGSQRGTGMHTRWVKEQKLKKKKKNEQSDLSESNTEQLANGTSNLSLSSDDSESGQHPQDKRSSTSDQYSPSNSNFLARHFPKRYFILKSLTQHDLDLSVQTGYWATQKHNEGILDQSYKTSKDVYLIFGVNKSGEFYGYARMAGQVRRGGQNIPWARSPPHPMATQSPTSGRLSERPSFFSGDHRLVNGSSLAFDAHTPHQHAPQHQSAPSTLGSRYNFPSIKFELDPSAPVRAMRPKKGESGSGETLLHSLEKVDERAEEVDDVQEPNTFSHEQGEDEEKGEELWGDCFAVEWISTERLPFNRTRQFRNPWNHDREVKISRDGTELEPTVGQRLLDEWNATTTKVSEQQQQQQPAENRSA